MNQLSCNISSCLDSLSRDLADIPAVVVPWKGERISFSRLHAESDRLASGLMHLGIGPGTRTLLMVPFGTDFILLTFALFKAGAVPILIDPGLGRKNILQCISESKPEAMVAVPLAHTVRRLFPGPFQTVRIAVTVGRKWFWGGATLNQVRMRGETPREHPPTDQNDPAAVLFTSGSTGLPKGVVYTHGMFTKQLELLRSCFGIQRGEIDLPTFPLFGLFGVGLGMTCVIPDMDFTRPARVDPEKIIGAILENEVTTSFGSPALWNTVTSYCLDRQVRLPSLRRILMAGAPVSGDLLKRFHSILEPDCTVATPYGATESLPVTSIDRQEILGETWQQTGQGKGTCVGRPVPGMQIKIIRINDDPIPQWDPSLELPVGEIGEIVVSAPWVTRLYLNREKATRLAKIQGRDSFWHRMGDVGYLDHTGRLWFCGRKSQRITTENGTMFTIPCEAIFNSHPDVRRSALVGIGSPGHQQPVIVIEAEKGSSSKIKRESLTRELLARASQFEHTRSIQQIVFHPDFPVDIRHNAKIFREQLVSYAEKSLFRNR